jgi:flagellar biosynthetic protein FlhB
MADDDDGKTEQPTGKKLGTARDEGNVAVSQEVKTAAMLTAITVVVWLMAPLVMRRVSLYLSGFLSGPHLIPVGTESELSVMLRDLAAHVALLMLMPLAFLLVVGVLASLAQTGWMLTFSKITPNFGKINPLAGFGRIFSIPSAVEFFKSLAKLAVVSALFFLVLRPAVRQLEILPALDSRGILTFLHNILVRLLLAILFFEVVIAAADWFFQRFNFLKKLRMTKQEVKDENKQTEGDPAIKARLRSLRAQRARQRMMAAVPKADVVVTNPTHFACALKYDPDSMNAPVLVAKGQDLVALRIRQLAEACDIPIVENPPLARALYASVDLDKEIPPDHYKAVAEVISYVFRLKGKLRR